MGLSPPSLAQGLTPAPKPQIPVVAKLQIATCHGPLQLPAHVKPTTARTYSLHGYMQHLITGCLLLFNYCFTCAHTAFTIRCSLREKDRVSDDCFFCTPCGTWLTLGSPPRCQINTCGPGGREQPGGSQPRAQRWAPVKPRSTSHQPTPQEADAEKGWLHGAWAGGQPCGSAPGSFLVTTNARPSNDL